MRLQTISPAVRVLTILDHRFTDVPWGVEFWGQISVKNIILAVVAVGFSATAASAAGPTVSTSTSAYDWSGFYAGADLGMADGHVAATDITEPNGGFFTDLVPAGTEGFDFNNANVVGGVHAGAQYQWQQLVFGGEATWDVSGISSKITSPYFPDSDMETGSIGQFATAVGRIGYSFDRFMVYGKAGYAGGAVGFKARDNESLVTYQQTNWQNGYAIGAGFDDAMTDTVSFGVDYTHIDLGSAQSTGNNVYDDGTLGKFPETYRTAATADAVMARLSFKFGGN